MYVVTYYTEYCNDGEWYKEYNSVIASKREIVKLINEKNVVVTLCVSLENK